jgi:hypothetical protein
VNPWVVYILVIALKVAGLWLYYSLMLLLGGLFFQGQEDFFESLQLTEKTLAKTVARGGLQGLACWLRLSSFALLALFLFLLEVGWFFVLVDRPAFSMLSKIQPSAPRSADGSTPQ